MIEDENEEECDSGRINIRPPARLPPLALVIDDSDADAFLIRHAFAQRAPGTLIIHLHSGEDGVRYFLERRRDHPIPNLIIMDIKMPGMGGFGLLDWLRTRPPYDKLATVMLSSSDDEDNILRAKELGAQEFFSKPADFAGYLSLIPKIHGRWLSGGSPTPEANGSKKV